MNDSQALIPVTVASAFLYGMILALLGSVKLALVRQLGIDEARVGGLLAALNLALIPLVLLSGLLSDSPVLGTQGTLILGSLLAGLAVFCLSVSRTYPQALGSVVGVGAGLACVSTGAVKLMPHAFFANQNLPAALNLGMVFMGLGALVTPSLAELLTARIGLRRTLSLLAFLCLSLSVAAVFTPAAAYPPQQEAGSLTKVLADPFVWVCGLVFMLYGPLEGALGTWATTYLTEMRLRERRAAYLLSGFWLAFLASRLLTAVLQERGVLPRGSEGWLVFLLALLAAVVLGNLAGTHSPGNAAAGLLAVGFILGPIFPSLVSLLFKHFDSYEQHGTAFGAMFAIGATGSLVLPPLIGAYAKRTASVRVALRIPTMMALLLMGTSLVLALW
jgi:MFS family permease